MVIDTFLYYNEIELLELRLKVLYDYVDRFVIVEGDHTHKGDPIPFRAKNDLKKLGYENDRKIHVIEVNLKSFDEEPDPWKRSDRARNAQASIYSDDDDIVIIADIDELWHPHYLQQHVRYLNENPTHVLINRCWDLQGQVDLGLYAKHNNECNSNAPLFAKGSFWKKHSPASARWICGWGGNKKDFPFEVNWFTDVKKGWHLSYMGNVERKLSKINTSCHWDDEWVPGISFESDYTKNRFKNFNGKPLTDGRDLLGRENFYIKPFDYTDLFDTIGDGSDDLKDWLLGRNI